MHLNALKSVLPVLALLCTACASPVIEDAERLSRAGHYEEALLELDQALRAHPEDSVLRTAHSRQRERVLVQALAQADLALASGRHEEAERLLERARRLDARQPRLDGLEAQLARSRQESRRAALPTPPAASAPPVPTLGPAFLKPVSLEFRDAPLRDVFEALARSSQVNFVFDKDVRADSRIAVFLRAVTLDEAMRVILSTQQLDRKLLNDNTVLVYPNTPAKQREHQDLVTRTLFLTNADAKQVQTMVRTMAKTRDLHVDERLNALVVRDTPEVVRMVEQLLATIDLPEPEVMLAVEVMEIATDRLEELGIGWPSSIGFGVPGSQTSVPLTTPGFRGLVVNPALAASLNANDGSTNLLANPTIRARNHEKAKVQIGEKLPVFTTTAAVNVGISSSVSYLDVGLKLDVEPSVQLDGEVIIKVALEVTNLLREVSGPQGSLAYQVGTRLTTTSLRLRDGQTQVLAGLISDEDRRRAIGLPGLTQLPLVGRLFGVHSDTRSKSEIVMLITPHIVHNLVPPDAQAATFASGTDSLPGATPLRLQGAASAALRSGAGGGTARPAAAAADAPQALPLAGLLVAASGEARVGDTVAVTLANRTAQAAAGELSYDAAQLEPASAPSSTAAAGHWPFRLDAQAEVAVIFRVLPAAAGQVVGVQASADVAVDGQAQIRILPGGGMPK
jgi:general secretion pathway protein D